jgi:hypothetical protein
MISNFLWLRGRVHIYSDGVKIEVLDVRNREAGITVIYEITNPGHISRRLVATIDKFAEMFSEQFPELNDGRESGTREHD